MKKVELLCPVGNYDMLYQAIHNGADAVYLSGKNFGARKYADNFNDDELVEAIRYSHLYGVLVYVTVNTMIYDSELDKLFSYLKFLYENGVDAVIMQDIGVIKKVRELIPGLVIHASTQCHNHNNEGIKLLRDLGVSRVVMAREMNLEEINSISVDIEKEVFVYGALCVCYSGLCLFSSMNGGRSGNRGECVGSCRLMYDLYENDKKIDAIGRYLLSTRELNTISHLKEILDSGIDSLKIEGRMKSPAYVGYVTRIYRRLIDNYYNNLSMEVDPTEINNLKKLFNRKFTNGYLFKDKNIMNIKSPNHIGIDIGKVINVTKKKIYIKLEDDNLNQEDGIRFKNANCGMIVNMLYDKKDLLVNSVNKGSICAVDNKFDVRVGDVVLKTIDSRLVSSIEKDVCEKKIEVLIRVKAYIGKKLEISISDNTNEIVVYGSIVNKSINRSVSCKDIEDKLGKLGNTCFRLINILIDMADDIFISMSELNNLRRELVSNLMETRMKVNRDKFTYELDDAIDSRNFSDRYNINILVRNEEQLLGCIDNMVDNIYIDSYELYLKYKDRYDNVYYKTGRVDSCVYEFNNDKLLVSDLGGIYKYGYNNYVVSDYCLNIANRYSVLALDSYNIKRICLSLEINDYEINNIVRNTSSDIELFIYGRVEIMTMKYCPLKEILNNCSRCKSNFNKYYLVSMDKKKYPIIHSNCYTSIMHYDILDKIDNIDKYRDMGILNYRVELFDEDRSDVDRIINRIKEKGC